MKEFKFWAITLPLTATYIIPFLAFAVFGVIFTFLIHSLLEFFFKYFPYIMGGILIYMLLFVILFVKRIRINFDNDEQISIFFNGKEKYCAPVSDLEYVRGISIHSAIRNAPVVMKFTDKKFTFNIFEIKGFPFSRFNNQVNLLSYMTERYSLGKEIYKGGFSPIYTYSNPNYKK